MEEAQKEALQKPKLQSWLEEAYQVTTTIQDQIKGLQQTQQTMRLVVKGPATEKLVEEVKQAATHGATEVAVIKVELGDLRNKIATPTE